MKIGRLKKLLYIGLFLGILNLVNGQMPLEDFFLSASFEQFDPNTEFPKNRITNLTEDPFGYIWIGTNQSGLYQYNGYEIKQFNANYKNPKSYPDVHVWNVLIARDSTIWFCHEKGFSTFNYDTQSFLNASEILDIDFDKGNQIGHSIFELNDSILIFGMTDGIWFFNRNQKAITKKTLQNNLPWPDYNAILQMTRNPNKPTELLIRSTRGIYLYNLLNDSEEFHAFHNGKITYLEHTPDVFVNNKLIFPGNGRLSLMEFDILKKESRVILKDTIQNSAGVFNMAYNWFQLLADSSILISTSKHEMLIYDPYNETSRKLKFGDKFKYGANPYLFDSNGYFWFSRDWDLFKSDTPFLPFKKHKAKAPHLHAMFINGNPVSFDRIQKKPLILKEFEKNIEFQVGKINPNPSDATKYEYQLKGESNKWQSFQNNQINCNKYKDY